MLERFSGALPSGVARLLGRSSFMRFGIAGGLNNLFVYCLFLALIYVAGTTPLVAMTVSFLAGVVVAYLLNRHWTFRDASRENSFWHFVAVYLSLYASNWVLLRSAVEMGLDPAISQFIILIVLALASFGIQKTWVFRVPK